MIRQAAELLPVPMTDREILEDLLKGLAAATTLVEVNIAAGIALQVILGIPG